MTACLIFFVMLASIGMSSSQNVEPAFLKASNAFSLGSYSEIVEGRNGSLIFSPASIQQALAMTSFGAVGTTKDEILAGLKFPKNFTSDDVARNCKILTDSVKSSPFLKIANKIFVKLGAQINSTFEAITEKSFGSKTQALDFEKSGESAKIINDWVEAQTNHKIKDLITSDSLTKSTRMVLVNAIYFLGNWEDPFDPRKTRKGLFYNTINDTATVDFMYKSDMSVFYTEMPELKAKAIKLAYKDTNISMLFVLPNSKTGLRFLENKLKVTPFDRIFEEMYYLKVNIQLPKFKIETEIDLNDILKSMGMQQMFTTAANFSGLMTGKDSYHISQVVQKAFIEVNELGTEAAAATGDAAEMSGQTRELYFTANHPFFYAIHDDNGVYFAGRVENF